MTADDLAPLITETLAAHRPELGSLTLDEVRGGLEFNAFFVRTEAGDELFLRAADERFSHNDNDGHVDARRLLVQEAELAGHLGETEIPVPEVHDLVLCDPIDLLLTEHVADDGSEIEGPDVLDLLSRLHRLAPPDVDLVAQEHPSTALTIAERLHRRLVLLVESHDLEEVTIPSVSSLRVAAEIHGESLVHLDVRRANMLVRDGEVVGLVDWTNALVGPPALEYARLDEYGEFEVPGRYFQDVPEPAELVFRLDAAVMLAVVFVSEAPSPEDAQRQMVRVRDLLGRLQRCSLTVDAEL